VARAVAECYGFAMARPEITVSSADPRSEAAAELLRALSRELAERYDFADDGTADFKPDDARVPRSAFVIGSVGGEAVACGALRPMGPEAAEIKRMYVAPSHRGRGYSKILLAELERLAGGMNYAVLRLETGVRQPEAIALYERAGFRRIPNYGLYADNPLSVCFEKRLAGLLTITTAQTRATLQQILDLQARNLASRLSPAEAEEQGFVTVKHDLALLERLCGSYRHVVALDGDALAGYALVMLKEFSGAVPVLVPMFEQIDRLMVGTQKLGEMSYFAMGQVCVDKPYRGRGVFQGMYEELKRQMSGSFERVVTEVATRNRRSVRAHAKVGFTLAAQYVSPDKESWDIISWDWR